MQTDQHSPALSHFEHTIRRDSKFGGPRGNPNSASPPAGFRSAGGESATALPETNVPTGAAPKQFRSALTTTARTEPMPPPQRPKNRWFVGMFLFAVGACAAFAIWNSFFRYAGYGMITGRLIDVSAPWEGVVQSFQVREGDQVRQGAVLLTIENIELNHQLARITDELHIAQAKLQAEMSQLQWQSRAREEQSKKAEAEYYEAWGDLLQHRAHLEDLTARIERFNKSNEQFPGVYSREEIASLQFEWKGEQAKTEKLAIAVDELKKRISQHDDVNNDVERQFKPQLALIESLKTELPRLRERLEQGQIRAPANGRVVKIHGFAGERADPTKPLVEIVEEGSFAATLYLAQNRTNLLKVGDEVKLWLKPSREIRTFEVTATGEQMEHAPECLQRRYARDEELLPVYLAPKQEGDFDGGLRLGSEVVLLN